MEELQNFIQSIYLGDRFCEQFIIDNNKILFQINVISRLKKGTKEWNYYSEEDIEHGYLVFDEVINFTSSSELPINDEIYEIEILEKIGEIYTFVIYGCNVSDENFSTEIELRIKAKSFYVFNPKDNSIVAE